MGGIASLDDPATDDKLLFLNHNIGKVFEVKSTSFKNIDVKTSEKAAEFVRLDTSVVLDLPVALQRDDGELAQVPELRVKGRKYSSQMKEYDYDGKVRLFSTAESHHQS